jgi:DNA gyrase subunit A
MQTSERNGAMIGALQVQQDDEIMLINSGGTLVRVPINEISVLGRNTQGVRVMRLGEDETVVSVERIAAEASEDEGEE